MGGSSSVYVCVCVGGRGSPWGAVLLGVVLLGVYPTSQKGHGTRNTLSSLEGTWDQRYHTPRGQTNTYKTLSSLNFFFGR